MAAAAVAALFLAPAAAPAQGSGLVEVVVTLDAPPLAQAISRSRVLTARVKAQRLDLRSPTSRGLTPASTSCEASRSTSGVVLLYRNPPVSVYRPT